jgi:hypothetical protein
MFKGKKNLGDLKPEFERIYELNRSKSEAFFRPWVSKAKMDKIKI